ncbi:MAG TPA: malonyl-ACP O-methyltransferase BioC [Gammaproteobacteria bacterium]|nr:malonyl-ACP O-methyltransferase BioC [Gammaproteobacteria bacterium]
MNDQAGDMTPRMRELRRVFDAAAPGYDAVSAVQDEIRQRMLERLELLRIDPRTVLDLGSGTGRGALDLDRRYRHARVLALDVSPSMLARVPTPGLLRRGVDRLAADARRLPLADDSVDMVFSNLMLQWAGDPEPVFRECHRVMTSQAVLMFTSLGPASLVELREAWQEADQTPHVNTFLDMHDVGDALVRTGFAEPVMDVETLTVTYPDFDSLTRELRMGGSLNLDPGRRTGLTGRRRYAAMRRAYQARQAEGRLPVTLEIVYGHAWRPGRLPAAGLEAPRGTAR